VDTEQDLAQLRVGMCLSRARRPGAVVISCA